MNDAGVSKYVCPINIHIIGASASVNTQGANGRTITHRTANVQYTSQNGIPATICGNIWSTNLTTDRIAKNIPDNAMEYTDNFQIEYFSNLVEIFNSKLFKIKTFLDRKGR